VLDFKSLYPSIIATFNISPELLNCKCCKNNGHRIPETNYWFCKNKKGFVSGVIKEIIEMRNKTKQNMKKLKHGEEWEQLDRQQYGLKIIANATYGYYAFAGAKWYCKQCAESAAALGRHFIHKIIEETEKTGFTVLYADTDSCFIKSENDFIEKTDVFLNKINKKLPGIMELELQGFYKRGIFIPKGTAPGTAKKRYALIDEKNNLVVRGLETVRRDWCNLAKELQRNVLVYILKNNDINAAVKYVKDTIKKIRNKEILLKDLVIYEQLTKPLSDYKQIGPHVVAARKIKERGRPVGAGMIVMFVITKGKGSISQRAEPIEDVSIDKIDENYYINNQIIPAALRVLQVLGVRHEQLLDSGLEKFLG